MSKKVTSKDVAKEAGVSQSLVSLILNDVPGKQIHPKTRAHVLSTARRLNYSVNMNARSMKQQRAGAIGILSSWDAHSFVFPPVINGIQKVCSENELGLLVCTGKKDIAGNEDYVDYYHQNRIDGLVYVSYVGVPYEGVIRTLTDNSIPFVCIIGARDIDAVSCVDVSFIESGYMAIKHLADKGYKRPAYIMGKAMDYLYAEKERYEGCIQAASDNGLELMLETSLACLSGERSLLDAASKVLLTKQCDAIVSTSYMCYIFLRAAADLGIKVPSSMGVISLDNELYAPYLYPSLTTIDEPLYHLAEKAVHILIDHIQGNRRCHKLEMSPFISERESTARGNSSQ